MAPIIRIAISAITQNMRVARLVITNGFLYFFPARLNMSTIDTIATSPIVIIGIVRVESEARAAAPVTSRIVDVVSCEAVSQRE